MKTSKHVLVLAFICSTLPLLAQNQAVESQHPLLGTWIRETDKEREIKIITPSHFMFMIEDIPADTLMYVGTGTYLVAGDFYKETIEYSNIANATNANPVYEYRLEGDTFYQKGLLVLSGSKNQLNHLFKKAKTTASYGDNPSIGTWHQISTVYPGGKKATTFGSNRSIYLITPTHWMWITIDQAKKLNKALGGIYTLNGNKISLSVEYGNFAQGQTIEYTQRVEANKLYRSGMEKGHLNEVVEVEEVFQKVYGN